MKPSWMTYGVLKDLPRAQLLDLLAENGFAGVEYRTDLGHGHGVEASLSPAQRRQVKAETAARGLQIVSVATGNSFHHPDPQVRRWHVDEAKGRIDLAADLGAPRIRVFGNELPEAVPRDQTIAQVAEALAELSSYGKGKGVKPCLELHGQFDFRACREVAERLRDGNFGLIWNCVPSDVVDGSLRTALDAVWPWLDHVHLHDLAGTGYPYRELFGLLHQKGYAGFLSAEAERSREHPPGDLPMFVAYYAELLRAYLDLARAGAE